MCVSWSSYVETRTPSPLVFFFFNDTATTEIYTLSLHDALPIFQPGRRDRRRLEPAGVLARAREGARVAAVGDRKSTRLNSSHLGISYAVFCLKKKNKVGLYARLMT